jgi:hypothetical protein
MTSLKTIRLFAGLLAIVVGCPAFATNPGFGFLPQPINLGARADPARIPLGMVPYYSNYGYGSTDVLTISRKADNGDAADSLADHDLNLASVFGISVEPFDSTQFPILPAVIRIKGGPPPAFSPYTKEQVLIATIHCVLYYDGTKTRPIMLRIETEDANDAHLLRYEGHYVTGGRDPKERVMPSRIPGSHIEVSPSGVETVVFKPCLCTGGKKTAAPQPGFIPFLMEQCDGSGPLCQLVPTWPGSACKEPVNRLTFLPSTLVYQVYHSDGRKFEQANSLLENAAFQTAAITGVTWSDSPECSMVSFDAAPLAESPDWFADTLAVTCQALVLGTRPDATRPLKVAISIQNEAVELIKDFTGAPGWVHEAGERRTQFRCTFVADPTSAKLVAGSIPGGTFEGLRFNSKRLAASE